MPTYSYACPKGHHFEVVCSMKEHRSIRVCECGEDASQVIDVPVFGWAQRDCHYDSPIDGRPITSWAQRRDDLARHGCQEYDPEMRKDADRFRAQKEAELDRAVDESVEREFETMPSAKRERLAAELLSGAEAVPTRL